MMADHFREASPAEGSRGSQNIAGNSYMPHWTTRVFDSTKLFSVQLLTLGGSGALAKTAVAPLERVKIIMQVQPVTTGHRYRDAWDAIRGIAKREGLQAFYRGNGVNVLRLLPDAVLKFALHDHIKLMFTHPDITPLRLRDRLAISATTGLMRVTLAYPLDLARTRITADTSKMTERKLYQGITDCLWKTYRREGVRGLYKGYFVSAAGVVPYFAVTLAAYDEMKDRLPESKEFRDSVWHPLAKMGMGAAAATLGQTVTFPVDTVRRRMQMSGGPGTHTRYATFWGCASTMLQKEGIASFYRGVGVNALRLAPGAAVQFLAYDFIKTSASVMEHSTGRTL